ncbi:hypothetical protein [Methanopyrus sp.]
MEPVFHTLLALLTATQSGVGYDTGCCTVLVHVHHGCDVVAYRRDAKYPAEILIVRTKWAGRNAIKEYKTRGGYFCHTVITEDGWIITIGGRDIPEINRELEKLGAEIVSKGHIEKGDIERAGELLKEAGWGHFVIKSPNDIVGVASYDYRISSQRVDLFKIKDGEYVKMTNNPNYYDRGNFKEFSKDPVDAAIEIAGKDTYGLHRRDVITYELNINKTSTVVKLWVSYDGGAMVGGASGEPDPVRFMGRTIAADSIPKIPGRKPLGEVTLRMYKGHPTEVSPNMTAVAGTLLGGAVLAVLLWKLWRQRRNVY